MTKSPNDEVTGIPLILPYFVNKFLKNGTHIIKIINLAGSYSEAYPFVQSPHLIFVTSILTYCKVQHMLLLGIMQTQYSTSDLGCISQTQIKYPTCIMPSSSATLIKHISDLN